MKHFFNPLAAFVVSAFAVTALWSWLGRPIDMVPVADGRFTCLSYVPTTPSGHPLMGPNYKIPAGLIERDLKALLPMTKCIRTYSSFGVQGEVLPVAAKLGLEVMLGVWIGADDKRNELEIKAALDVARQYPDAVRAIIVGNEVLLRREMSGERLAGIINSVKARTPHPVAYADIYEFWRRNPVVGDAADKLLVHVLPYWDDPTPVSIHDVQGQVRKVVDQMRTAFPQKDVEIGEIGWPSAGRTRGHAVPNRVNQARFMREFAAQAGTLGVRYNLIEAIDQPWKRAPEGTAGGYWGVLDTDRTAKFPLIGPVREWPDWTWAAALSVAVGALCLGLALLAGRRPGLGFSLGIAFSGAVTGTCLWMLAIQLNTIAIGMLGQLWAAYLIALACAGGLSLVVQSAGLAPSWRTLPAPLSSVIVGCRQRALTPAQKLGLVRWVVLLPAAIISLAMAVDGRHRDFLTLAFMLPALALAVQTWRFGAGQHSRAAEDGWISLLLIGAGLFAVDTLGDREALAWAATCVLLGLPGLPAIAAETRRLCGVLSAQRQHQQG